MKSKRPKHIRLSEEIKKSRSAADKNLLETYGAAVKARHAPPKLKVKNTPGNITNISTQSEDAAVNAVSLMSSFGTTSSEFASYSLRELIDASCSGNKVRPYSEEDVNGIVAAMHGINPKDEIEGMLASQMVATHFAAMRVMRQLKNCETIAQQDSNGNLAMKLLRTYTAQVEALSRYRGKGQQKMTVEHVHVHPGGQAIVGNVIRSEGGGISTESEEQPYAKQIAHAPEQAMPSPYKASQPVPVPRHA